MKKTSAVKTSAKPQTKKLVRGRYTLEFKEQSRAPCAAEGVAVTARDLGIADWSEFS